MIPTPLLEVIQESDRVSIDAIGRVWSHVRGVACGTGVSLTESERSTLASAFAREAREVAIAGKLITAEISEPTMGHGFTMTIDVAHHRSVA